MNAQRLAKMLSNAWHITRTSNTRVMYRCAHIMIADGLLSITATDGFRLLRQVEPLNAPDAMFAVDIDDVRMQVQSARDEFQAQKPDVVAIDASQNDGMACVTLSAAGDTRRVRIPIAAPPYAERTAWTQIPTLFNDHATAQWASITDAAYARKALAALTKSDRCYAHVDNRWLHVWRHSDASVSAGTTIDARAAVLTASAPDATLSTRVRVNPQWLQQAARLFASTIEIGVTPISIVLADRRTSPLTMVVIMGMRPEPGDA